jgi:ATP-dependent exoDNAse (exonuclease V) beta subunit
VIRQRAAAYDTSVAILADLWTQSTLRNVLLQLIELRSISLPWAKRITQDTFPNYLHHLQTVVEDAQRRGIRQLALDRQWQETITLIRTLIPDGDTSKLTYRCLNILDYDSQFRTQTTSNEQLITLKMLRKDCRMVAASQKWKEDGRNVRLQEAFSHLKLLYDQYLPSFEVQEGLEKSGFTIQQALAELFLWVYDLYQQEKASRRVLDFDDLQERARSLLENPQVHPRLSHRYDYIMVDEFQDTNQLQWDIIKKLGMAENTLSQNKFCIVGDEKQSIYMFRGAEVAVFGDVRRELQQANVEHDVLSAPLKIPPLGEIPESQENQKKGELIMAENFRSTPALIFFFNALFSRIFLPSFDSDRFYDVPHQELIAGRKASPPPDKTQPVEFLLVYHAEEASDEQSQLNEPELVALRICELVESRNYADIALLLRTRTRLKEFEDALRRHDIPFVVAGGIGFFQQQEVYDLANLLRVLVDHRQDIALAGVLRSPLLSFSDDQLLYLVAGTIDRNEGNGYNPTMSLRGVSATKRSLHIQHSLWERLEHHARSVETIPEELDPSKFLHAYNLLRSWKSAADRIPITYLLRRILEDTGLYGILSGSRREVQSFINIEKLLDIARTFESVGFQTLSDFVAYLDLLIELEEREGEAQINFEGMNAVRLMTIHAAKGLQFPVVFVLELDRAFNYGTGESIYIDALKSGNGEFPVVGIKGLDPEQNYASENTVLRNYLKRVNTEKTDAEMKRLLYVACTRAQDQLVLSGTLSQNIAKNSWLSWFMDILPLKDALAQRSFTISEEIAHSQGVNPLQIPVRTSENYEKCGGSKKPGKAQQVFPSREENIPPSDIDRILRQNLTPISGAENEIFKMNPSTVSILFQCPRKYYYQHILRLPEYPPLAPNTVDLRGSVRGELVEPPVKKPFDRLRANGGPLNSTALPLPPPERGYSPLTLPIEEEGDYGAQRGTIIHRLFEERLFDNDFDEQELFAVVTRFLDEMNISEEDRQAMQLHDAIQRAYDHYQASGLRDLLAISPHVHREYPFQLRIGQADISGTIDVLFFDPDHETWTILDYKSNEIETEQVAEEVRRHGYDIQMQMYALAVSRLLHTGRIRSVLFFTFPGSLYDAVDLSPHTLKVLEMNISNFLAQLSTGTIDVSHKQSPCEECGYLLYKVCSDLSLPKSKISLTKS